jgi:hypothetical protein
VHYQRNQSTSSFLSTEDTHKLDGVAFIIASSHRLLVHFTIWYPQGPLVSYARDAPSAASFGALCGNPERSA